MNKRRRGLRIEYYEVIHLLYIGIGAVVDRLGQRLS